MPPPLLAKLPQPLKQPLAVLMLALAYFVTGKLGLLLSTPPGYATIIWPPSGIAIGALLLFGAELWPGVFLGSLILNGLVGHAWTLIGHVWSSGGLAFTPTLVALGIATGSTLQAVGVRLLIQRWMRLPIELTHTRDVALLLTLCGPIGCLIAATCGVLTLTLAGAMPPDKAFHNWLTWWGGDLFGVCVFLPLMLVLPGAPTRLRWKGEGLGGLPVAGLLILLLSLGVTFYAWKMVTHNVYEKNAAEFTALAQESETALLHRIDSYQHVLLGGVGFFQGAGTVSRAQWRTYVEAIDIRHNYPGIDGIGWIADVRPQELQDFTDAVRSQGQDNFAVHPETASPDHFIIEYIEPVELNREAVGLNIAFEKNRYEAALLARASRSPVITKPITLVQADKRGPGFLMLVPIYDRGSEDGASPGSASRGPATSATAASWDPASQISPPHAPAELGSAARALAQPVRQRPPVATFRGWVYAAFVAESFLKDLTNSQGRLLQMQVYDQDQANIPIYDSHADPIYASHTSHLSRNPAFSVHKVLSVGHRHWAVTWQSTPEFETTTRGQEPTLVLASGVLLTFALGGILMVLARRAETVALQVRQKTQQLLENEQRYQTLVDGVTDSAIYRLDASGCVRSWNTGAHRLKGYLSEEIIGYHFSRFCTDEDRSNGEPARLLTAAAAAGHYAGEGWWVRKDGRRFWASFVIYALRNSQGGLIGFANVVRDTTQTHEVEQLKSEFISTVSHELRTPLTSIRGSLGLLEAGAAGKLPDKARGLIKIAHHNSERLVRIINDILDIEKIESGKLTLNLQSIDVAPFLQHALEVHQTYGHKYQVHFVLDPVPGSLHVSADPDRLSQVVANLISNAAKFSQPGAEVHVRARPEATHVRFEVEDHGAGIPEEFRSRVFEKFAQADASASRRFEGTGLGLSITRQLVQAMGGTIGFTSREGQGTTFYFDLPRLESRSGAAQPATTAHPMAPATAITGAPVGITPCSTTASSTAVPGVSPAPTHTPFNSTTELPVILHVEDDEDLSNILSTTLTGKATIVPAATLHAARQLLKTRSFSLLVLDPGLPDGNGLTLLDEAPHLHTQPLPIIILSVTEVGPEIQQRVAATIVKSRVSESRIAEIILSALPQPAASKIA
jgi:PAS domain S-box-containing protein